MSETRSLAVSSSSMSAANWGPTPSCRSRLRRRLSSSRALTRLSLDLCSSVLPALAPVGFLEVRARAQGLATAAREHPGDAEEQETHSDTAHEHEGG